MSVVKKGELCAKVKTVIYLLIISVYVLANVEILTIKHIYPDFELYFNY